MSIISAFKPIIDLLSGARPPATNIPPLVIWGGARLKPGLSARAIASKIISRQGEAGAPVGVLPSGNKNIAEEMEIIRIEEIIKALIEDARIDIAIDPGIAVKVDGASGPSLGTTVAIGSGHGVIR
jgi:hypothetical protein